MTWEVMFIVIVFLVCATGVGLYVLWIVHDSEPIEVKELDTDAE